MIPRYQRILFWMLAAGCLTMTLLLVRGCQQAHKRLAAMHDESPIAAPIDTPQETIPVALANDAEDSVAMQQTSMSLPQDPALRARALLERIAADCAKPESAHPLPSGASVDDVFFLDLPPDGIKVAVVNLRGAFADQHPSGIETEDLTLRSFIGTLHANFPQVAQVRFLVDGKPRPTLAGHAVLNRPYPAVDTVEQPLHVLAEDGSRQ